MESNPPQSARPQTNQIGFKFSTKAFPIFFVGALYVPAMFPRLRDQIPPGGREGEFVGPAPNESTRSNLIQAGRLQHQLESVVNV